jgi:hypothetical protein
MLVAPQFVGVAAVPLNLTVLVPCVAPKFAPAIDTEVPTGPEVGFKLAMLAAVGFPPPPGFEYEAPLHPVFVMISTTKSIDSTPRRKASLNVIVFIARYILLALHMSAQAISAGRHQAALVARKSGAGHHSPKQTRRRKSVRKHSVSEKNREMRHTKHLRSDLSGRRGTTTWNCA